jgi:hypothetical protein
VLIGTKEAVIHYSANDNFPDFNDYITFETSLNLTGWADRDYVRAIKAVDLKEGANWFYVRGRDFANNPSADPTSPAGRNASVKLTVDTLPPSTTVMVAPPAFTKQTQAQVTYSGSDAGSGVIAYKLMLDGAALPGMVTATTRTFNGLAEGPHSIKIQAVDRVSHVDPTGVEAIFTVDLTAPKSALTGARTGYVKPSAARFAVLGNDNFTPPSQITFATKLDGPACATEDFSGFTSMANIDVGGCALADGEYTLHVKAQDLAGNEEEVPAQRKFIVDGTSPRVQFLGKPAPRSTDEVLEFLLLGQDNLTPPQAITYTYRLRGLTNDYSSPVSDPHVVIENIPSGDYVFEVTALDYADNQSMTAAYPFQLDNRAPTTIIDQNPPQWITDAAFSLSVRGEDDRASASELQFEVQLDGGAAQMRSAPLVLEAVEEGHHTAIIRAVDSFGNKDPIGVSTQFTVDRTAPETALTKQPTRLTEGSYRPTITASDNFTPQDEIRYTYRLSRGASIGEWSAPVILNELQIPLRELGVVTLEIAAVDNAGLVDETPIKLNADVTPASGCACSSSETNPEDLLSFLMLSAAVLFIRRRIKRT